VRVARASLGEQALAYIPDRVKRQWLEFAHKLVEHPSPRVLLQRLSEKSAADSS
jgi:hypothetical protein